MRLRADGYYEATTWSEHMDPAVVWTENKAFSDAFEKEIDTMTTSVKIDAHAGWPVLVTFHDGERGVEASVRTETVEPGTERTYYIHSGMRIIGIEEQPQRQIYDAPSEADDVPPVDETVPETPEDSAS